MKVLADRHHSDLYHSLQLLFEDRLGWELYTPVGHDWWDEGYWRFGHGYGDDRLAKQFLATNGWHKAACNCEGRLTNWDQHHPSRPIEGVTLERAKAWDWDVILATVDDNQAGFHRFAAEKSAKYAVHIGNARQFVDYTLNPIILDLPQEFDHTWTFRYRKPRRTDRVTSFVNLLPLIPEMWDGFAGLQARLPSVEFRSYGHHCPDGFRDPAAAVATEMAKAGWAYHDKVTGDGFGHVIHDWAAVGRPLIGHASYYAGQRAEPLWIDGVTCIDLDRHSLDDAAERVRTTSVPQHAAMCEAIRAVLDGYYDPARDAEIVRGLLG